jgi:type 1 fimbria pilin
MSIHSKKEPGVHAIRKCRALSVETLRAAMKSTAALAAALLCVTGATQAQTANISVTGRIVSKTCNLSTADLTIDMGRVPLSEVAAVGVGSAITRSSNGNIVMMCNAVAPSITMTIQDAQSPASTLPYLTLTGGATAAAGIGIQLFQQNGTPIPLGPDATWIAGIDVPAGRFAVPIVAHYYRTATTVTAGGGNASALFQVSYD